MTCFLIEWEEMGGGEQAGVGWGICLTDSLCVASASSFLRPLFASIDQFGNLGRFSQLGLAQGAELAAGLGWHLRPPPSLGGSRELWKAPFPSSGDVVAQASYPGDWNMLASALFFLYLPLECSWQLSLPHSPSNAMSLFGCSDSAMSLQ